MSNLGVDTLKDSSGNNAMALADLNQGRAKAWFTLNGTGTIAARDSFNCSSFVDNGTGLYTVNFTTVFLAADYCFALGSQNTANFPVINGRVGVPPTAGAIAIETRTIGNVAADVEYCNGSMVGDR